MTIFFIGLKGSTVSLTPDDDVFKHLALTYATNHPTMHQGVACKSGSPSFPNGTTNGAGWYPLIGGVQDYSYVWAGTMEITVEMSCCKYPPAAELPNHWLEHRQSLVSFLGESQRGVRGFVTDPTGRPLENVAVKIKGRDAPFQTTKYGEYWRILLPGYYRVEVGFHIASLHPFHFISFILFDLFRRDRLTRKDLILPKPSSSWRVITWLNSISRFSNG